MGNDDHLQCFKAMIERTYPVNRDDFGGAVRCKHSGSSVLIPRNSVRMSVLDRGWLSVGSLVVLLCGMKLFNLGLNMIGMRNEEVQNRSLHASLILRFIGKLTIYKTLFIIQHLLSIFVRLLLQTL
jgi:hypothetical protein